MPSTSRRTAASARHTLEMQLYFDLLTSTSSELPPPEQFQHLQLLRQQSTEASTELDVRLAEEVRRLRLGIDRANVAQKKLRELLERVTAPPLHPALFLGWASFAGRDRAAMVSHGNARRVVNVAEGADPESIEVGDEVLLGSELNVLVGKSPYDFLQGTETASFDRYANGSGRAILRWRDEELVATLGNGLKGMALKAGDQVRWDRTTGIAFEKIERSHGDQFFLEEIPNESFDSIGGLDRQIRALKDLVSLHFRHPEAVEKYRLKPKRSAILVGPPGTGKTMLARALASWLATRFGDGKSRFMHIKPSLLNSVWFSQSEANYREAFRIARLAGAEDTRYPVIIYFDEVDSVAAARGHSLMRVDDRVLTAFMAELDGLEARGNVLVIASTNRQDALDPAVVRPGRLGDLVLEVPRPNRQAAGAIFNRYLVAGMPYSSRDGQNRDGQDAEAARQEIIESVVSQLYDPNADNDVAKLTFRDGKQRTVKAKDLLSGANIAKIAGAATELACLREVETGESGIRLEDLSRVACDELDSLARMLTPANCRKHVTDLPTDVDVVRVDSLRGKASRSCRHLSMD